jgi:hypothetical protein
VNDNGESALHYAAKIKKTDLHFPQEDSMIIKLLMEHGSDVFMQTKNVRSNFFIMQLHHGLNKIWKHLIKVKKMYSKFQLLYIKKILGVTYLK